MWVQTSTKTPAVITSPLIIANREETWRCLTSWYYITAGKLVVNILEQSDDDSNKMNARQSWLASNSTSTEWGRFSTWYSINEYKQYKVRNVCCLKKSCLPLHQPLPIITI